MRNSDVIPSFFKLAPSIHIQISKILSDVDSQESFDIYLPAPQASPDLIIMTTWTGAAPKHISKYTRAYNELYPSAPLLVITTEIADLVLRSTKKKVAALAPAVEFLRQRGHNRESYCAVYNNILLHAFSEGGSNKAVCLAQAFLATTGNRLPVGAFVFDSTPGKPRYSNNLAALRLSLPRNQAVRLLGLPVGAAVLGMHYALFSGVLDEENNVISKTRRALNDSTLWEVEGVPRTYIFSEADALIAWKDIEEHATWSETELGIPTTTMKFKNTGHCEHARGNSSQYWDTIRKTWEGSITGGRH